MQFGTHSSTGSTAQVVSHSLDGEPAAGSRPGTMVRTASQAQQQLVDRSMQNSGCNGGSVDAARSRSRSATRSAAEVAEPAENEETVLKLKPAEVEEPGEWKDLTYTCCDCNEDCIDTAEDQERRARRCKDQDWRHGMGFGGRTRRCKDCCEVLMEEEEEEEEEELPKRRKRRSRSSSPQCGRVRRVERFDIHVLRLQ